MEQQNNNTKNKLTDKAFSRFLITSVIGILVCIACLCSSTYAWFAESIPSSNNTIASADSCLLTVTLEDDTVILDSSAEAFTADLVAGVEYKVTLTLQKDSASGYCLIKAGGVTYRTNYLARHSNDTPSTLTFTLRLTEDKTLSFIPHWGISAQTPDVRDGGTLTI